MVVGLVVLPVACGIAIRRDLSALPAGQVGFDDMCGLQGYFDALQIGTSPPPRVVSALDLEGAAAGATGGKPTRGGRERFAFENDFQLKHVRRVLNENWQRLPDGVATATKIEIDVRWAEKAGSKRVVTTEPVELEIGSETVSLPYHICLSELLYGEPLYRQRRAMWGLPLPGPATAAVAPSADAGSRDSGTADAAHDATPMH